MHTGTAPRTMATPSSTALGLLHLAGVTNIAAALRHRARQSVKIIASPTSAIPNSHTVTCP